MKRILLLAIATVALNACADFELKTRDQLRDSEQAPAKKEIKVAQATAATPPPESNEETASGLRQFQGRMEEMENQVHQAMLTMQANKDEANKQNQAQDQKITALEEEIKKLEGQVAALHEQINKPKAVATDAPGLITEGDELAANKKYKEAIVSYQKYRDGFPKGNKYGEVTYKIGTCFQELGMKDEAKAFYEEVVSKYAKYPISKTAAKKLKSIK